jgi:hypothetical protein
MTDENEHNQENENQENESHEPNESNDSGGSPEPQESQPAEISSDASAKIALIEEIEGKMRLLRWGMLVGIVAVMAIGLYSIYKTSMDSIKPAVAMYKEAEETYKKIEPRISDAKRTINRLTPKAKKAYNIFDAEYRRLEPKATQAYRTVRDLADSDSKSNQDLRRALQVKLDTEIKPAARDISQKALIDLQDDALEQFKELTAQSEVIMFSARKEYYKLTNSLPDRITEVIEATLVKTINAREAKMREMFPKLTKEKQAEVVSRLGNFSDEQSEKIFIALFTDHLSELGKLQDAMDAIYDKEGDQVEHETNVESTIALLQAMLGIAMIEFGSEAKKKRAIPKPGPKPEPKPEPKPTPKPKPEPTPNKKDSLDNE